MENYILAEWWFSFLDHDSNDDNWENWPLSDECKQYWRERQSWQQVVIEEGVTEIPEYTFRHCKKIKRVIFADTVIRIERWAFGSCRNLTYIKLSINIEVTGEYAFCGCDLTSVFIPPRCTTIGSGAFRDNYELTLFHVHPNVQLGEFLLSDTRLLKESRFELD